MKTHTDKTSAWGQAVSLVQCPEVFCLAHRVQETGGLAWDGNAQRKQ